MRAGTVFFMIFLMLGGALVALGALFTRAHYQVAEINELNSQVGRLQQELDAQRAQNRDAVAEVAQLRDQLEKMEEDRGSRPLARMSKFLLSPIPGMPRWV